MEGAAAPSQFSSMKTLIFDIDGTLTDMWPLEKAVLLRILGRKLEKNIETLKVRGINNTYTIYSELVATKVLRKERYTRLYNKTFNILLKKKDLPKVEKYPLTKWIIENRSRYNFVYATGGQRAETLYVLRSLGLLQIFDVPNSLDKSTCRLSKATGIPFRKIQTRFSDCVVITDGAGDCKGAAIAGVPFIRVQPGQQI